MDLLEEYPRGEIHLLFAPYQEVHDSSVTNGEVELEPMGKVALPGFSTVK